MPWKATSPTNERLKFVAAMLGAEVSSSELCKRFGIRQEQAKTYESERLEGTKDRCHAPRSHPHAVAESIADLIVRGSRSERSARADASDVEAGNSEATVQTGYIGDEPNRPEMGNTSCMQQHASPAMLPVNPVAPTIIEC
jgi:hypothetical protein